MVQKGGLGDGSPLAGSGGRAPVASGWKHREARDNSWK